MVYELNLNKTIKKYESIIPQGAYNLVVGRRKVLKYPSLYKVK